MRLLRLKRSWCILLLPLSLGLVAFAAVHPAVIERLYARGFYPLLQGALGRLFSLLPFSLAEWLVVLLPIALFLYVTVLVLRLMRDPAGRRQRLTKMAANLLCAVGVGFFVFQLFCGVNYHRESFAEASGLEVRDSSVEELAELCEDLVWQANALRETVYEDENGVMTLTQDSYYSLAQDVQAAYTAVGKRYAVLGGYTVRPKPVLFSRAMSYLDIGGIYMPFTFEANVNVDAPPLYIPATMMHELAHAKGYMREEEANFIAYLACMESGNSDFAYSGTVHALVHSSNQLYEADAERFWEVRALFSDGVNRDLAANSEYWRQFEGPAAKASTVMNDVYLRSNRQTAGVMSYGQMVDLLLADHRQRDESKN